MRGQPNHIEIEYELLGQGFHDTRKEKIRRISRSNLGNQLDLKVPASVGSTYPSNFSFAYWS
jgi:hypothetical protein